MIFAYLLEVRHEHATPLRLPATPLQYILACNRKR